MCVVDYSAMLFLTTVAMPVSGLIWAYLGYKLILKSLKYNIHQAMDTLKAEVLG